MPVNPISFGKIIQVNAPITTAETIARIANSQGETELSKQIKNIIDDTRLGEADECPYQGSKDKSYIFSGEEGKKLMESFNRAYDEMDDAFIHNKSNADILSDKAWKRHAKETMELIAAAKEVPVMDIKYDEFGKIQSVNIIA